MDAAEGGAEEWTMHDSQLNKWTLLLARAIGAVQDWERYRLWM